MWRGKVIICDKNVSASGGGRGLKTVEHIEKLSRYRGIEVSSRDLKTVAISVTRALSNVAGKVIICDKNVSASGGGHGLKTVEHIEHIEKLSRYRGIEQGLENCRNIGHSSKVRLYEHMVCM